MLAELGGIISPNVELRESAMVFGPKVKVVERGRVGLRKKTLTKPQNAARCGEVEFVQQELVAMGLNGWSAISTEESLSGPAMMSAIVSSQSGNQWKISYGDGSGVGSLAGGNMVFAVVSEADPSTVNDETKQVCAGLRTTLGFV